MSETISEHLARIVPNGDKCYGCPKSDPYGIAGYAGDVFCHLLEEVMPNGNKDCGINTMNNPDVTENPQTPNASAPASDSEQYQRGYSVGYQSGRKGQLTRIAALKRDIERLKAHPPTQDACVDFLINRAEVAVGGACALLGIPLSEDSS